MLLFFDMKLVELVVKKLQQYLWPTLLAYGGAILAFLLAVYACVLSFTNHLVAGPRLVTGESFDGTDGVVRVTPSTLDNAVLRGSWNVGSAFILFGVGLFLFTIGQVIHGKDTAPLFSTKAQSLVRARAQVAFCFLVVGGLVRQLLPGRIASALEIETIETPDDADFDLWVFDIPLLGLLYVASLVWWVWKQGEALQSDAETTV